MTAALAIAATSEVLRFIVEDALVRAAQAVGVPAPGVTVGPPARPAPTAAGNVASESASVNLFLHHVAPNAAWRNMRAPERDGQGRRLNNAPLVLDLHYLLSGHGTDIDREIGFGTAMHALHQAPIVPRDLIRKSLQLLASAPSPRKALAGERLADQFEQLTITQQLLDIDAVTKIWTAAQAPYRPSAGYLVTTVFLEDEKQGYEAPGVRDAGIGIVALDRISIERVTAYRGDVRVAATPGVTIMVEGEGLAGPGLEATLDGAALTADGAASKPGKLVFVLPDPIAVGSHFFEISRLGKAGGHAARIASAGAALIVLPRPVLVTPNVTPAAGDPSLRSGSISVALSPPVARERRVALRLAETTSGREIESVWKAPAGAPGQLFATLDFAIAKAPAGAYLARVSIDGLLSQPEPLPGGALGPLVTL